MTSGLSGFDGHFTLWFLGHGCSLACGGWFRLELKVERVVGGGKVGCRYLSGEGEVLSDWLSFLARSNGKGACIPRHKD